MRLLPFLFLALATNAVASAQSNRDDLTPLEISYNTTVSEDHQSLRIDMRVENVRRPTLHVVMPAWTPGAYRIGNYGTRVEDLLVMGLDEGTLEVTRMDSGSWSIATEGVSEVQLSYKVPISRRGRFSRRSSDDDTPSTGLQIRGPGTYLYVKGAKDRPVTSRYNVPDGWRVANGLLPTNDPDVRYARDYDTFIDAPTIVGIFEERTFEVNGTPFSCVFFEDSQEYDFDIDAFVAIVDRIVTSCGNLYGSFPFPHYVFLFTLPGGGGLEHLNSTSIGLRASSQKANPEAGASVTAHEFFHTWNVKRIRPKVLGPFDYTQENYTGNLWVSEGWTSYFGDLTLVRTGIIDPDEFLKLLRRIISREQNKERRLEHSVTWASRNTWHRYRDEEGSRVDYYGKGQLLGCLIDLTIRHETGGGKSLNDVMRFLNRWFAERNVGFEEGDIERACTAISNHEFSEFFARHVHGTMDPPLGEILAYAGIDYSEEVIECSFPFPVRGTRISGRRPTGETEDEQPEGPRPGETIVSIDGVPFENADAFLQTHAAGDVLQMTLGRNDEEREVEVTLIEARRMIPSLSYSEDATEQQRRIREDWLTSVD